MAPRISSIIFLVLFFVCSAGIVSASVFCPVRWTLFPRGGKCAAVFYRKNPWWLSRQVCQKNGGDLISIRDRYQLRFVSGLLSRVRQGVWIGLEDSTIPGTFRWVDGTVLKASSSNWNRGEPNGGRYENCVEIMGHKGDKWNDLKCGNKRYSLCERPALSKETTTTPTTTTTSTTTPTTTTTTPTTTTTSTTTPTTTTTTPTTTTTSTTTPTTTTTTPTTTTTSTTTPTTTTTTPTTTTTYTTTTTTPIPTTTTTTTTTTTHSPPTTTTSTLKPTTTTTTTSASSTYDGSEQEVTKKPEISTNGTNNSTQILWSSSNTDENAVLSDGTIAGIAIGCIGVVVIGILMAVLFVLRERGLNMGKLNGIMNITHFDNKAYEVTFSKDEHSMNRATDA